MSQDERFRDVEKILSEVRDALSVTEESQRINELEALQLLLEVTRAIHSLHDIQQLITLALDSVLAFSDGDRAFLMMVDENGQLRFKMGRTADGNYIDQSEFTPSKGAIARTLENKRALIVPDAQTDGELSKRMSILDLQLRTIMCSPLMIKGEAIGVLYVDSTRTVGRYSQAHLNVITSLSDQAAIAIKNAQKFDTQT
jgi:GAF domain-containing protein